MAEKVVGYYVYEGSLCAEAVYVVIDEGKEGELTVYNPVRGKSVVAPQFRQAAFRLSKQDYLNASKGYDTPEEYL